MSRLLCSATQAFSALRGVSVQLLRVLVEWMRREKEARHFYTLAAAAGTLVQSRKKSQKEMGVALLEELQSALPPINQVPETSPSVNEVVQELFGLLDEK